VAHIYHLCSSLLNTNCLLDCTSRGRADGDRSRDAGLSRRLLTPLPLACLPRRRRRRRRLLSARLQLRGAAYRLLPIWWQRSRVWWAGGEEIAGNTIY
jgi:hypothetical protein